MLGRIVSALIASASVPVAVAQIASSEQDARAASVGGQVSTIRSGQTWALSAGDRLSPQQVISTGSDGYARFEAAGGTRFEIFSNSRIVFRENPANPGDLLDVAGGHVRIEMKPSIGVMHNRVFCPVAVIAARERATIAISVDEDDSTRIDVVEGAVRVQHLFFPRSEPILVTAIDAILVERDERISRRVDRGSLYRFTVRPFIEIWSAILPGRSTPRTEKAEFASSGLTARASSSQSSQSSAE